MVSKMLLTAFFGVISITLVTAYANIKITDDHISFINESFIDSKKYDSSLNTYNDSYTNYYLRWPIIKDFPEDAKLTTEIERIVKEKGKDDYRKYIDPVVITICDLEDTNRKYLPNFLRELTEDGNCIKKGDYKFDDAGQVPIEKLLPPDSINGSSFKAYNRIESKSEGLIEILEIISESD